VIGRHRIGLLSQALLMLGVVPMADAVARMAEQEERELAEVTRNLAAAGLDAEQIKLAFGESEFVNRARLCLEVDHILRASGQGGDTITVISMARDLLGPERPIVSVTAPPAGKASLLEVSGRRGPGRQLRDERERVGEPLRVLAAYAGLTAVELGEIERGVRIPTAEEWVALQVALPELGPMEAPPTEAERSPIVRARSEVADLVLHTRLLHPAGRCTCAGDGTCEWCVMDLRRTKREDRQRRRRGLVTVVDTAENDGAGAAPLSEVVNAECSRKRVAKQRRAKIKARKGWA
jgi:hypothetical protein